MQTLDVDVLKHLEYIAEGGVMAQLERQVWTEYGRKSASATQASQITVFDRLQSRRGG